MEQAWVIMMHMYMMHMRHAMLCTSADTVMSYK